MPSNFLIISPDGDCLQGLPKNALAEKNKLDWLAPIQPEFFQPFSDDFRRSGERLNQWLRFLFVLGGFVAFLGGVSFAHILALLSLAVPF